MIRPYCDAPSLNSKQMDRAAIVISHPARLSSLIARRRQSGMWNTPNSFLHTVLLDPYALRVAAVSAAHLLEYGASKEKGALCSSSAEICQWLYDAAYSPRWIAYGPLVVAESMTWPDATIGKKNTLCVGHAAAFLAEVAYGR